MIRVWSAAGFAASLSIAAASAPAGQLPPRDMAPSVGPATGIIRGIITAADTGRPIRGAEIRLNGGPSAAQLPRGTVADEAGRYEIRELPPGQYALTASKAGYMAVSYGQTHAAGRGQIVRVASAKIVEHVDIELPRGAVIVVRLEDRFGSPAAGYTVSGYQPTFSSGQRRLTPIVADGRYVTDDRGEIRLSGLAPGTYYVGATPRLGSSAGMKELPTFYPGTASEADAHAVTVGVGEQAAIFFQLGGARVATISGVIEGAQGPPTVRLESAALGGASVGSIALSPDGRFRAPNLPPGEYLISARGVTESGTLRVHLAGDDVAGLVLAMKPAVIVRGRLVFEPAPPPRGSWPRTVQLRPMFTEGIGVSAPAVVDADWSFEIPRASGTGVLRFDQPPAGWFLESVLIDGRDVADTPLDFDTLAGRPVDVVLTNRPTEVSGRVVDAGGRPVAEYVAVIFAEERERWTPQTRAIAAARPNQKGQFLFRNVPPGRYLIAAVGHLAAGEERLHSTLERLRPGARSLTLGRGQTVSGDLQLTP